NLGSMIHELQLRVALRRLGTVPDHRPVGSFEKAEERPRPGVVVGCHSFDRRLSPEPGDRAGTIGSIGVAPAHPVPEGHTLSRDPGYTLPAVVEVLGRIWPSIVERPDLTHLYDDGRLPHRRCGFPRAAGSWVRRRLLPQDRVVPRQLLSDPHSSQRPGNEQFGLLESGDEAMLYVSRAGVQFDCIDSQPAAQLYDSVRRAS